MKNIGKIVALSSLALVGCSKKSSTATSSSVKLNMISNAASASFEALSIQPLDGSLSPFAVGSNTSSQLQSLKYVFGGISICESLTANGSAFSSPSGCVSIYSGPVIGDGSSGSITPATLSTYASSQIDLMDSTSRAKLNSSASLTTSDARSYNYAVINWYTPIAAKGCANAGSSLVCTKSTGSTYSSGTTTSTAAFISTSTADAQEAIVVSANGGSYFKFQSPFVISSADLSAGTSFTVDLVFDPSAVLTASSTSNADGNLRGSDASMYVPMLSIAPVPRKGTQTTKRETYITTGNCSAAKYRVELYYNSDDSTSILGATGSYVPDSTSSSFSIMQSDMGSKVVSISKSASDGTLTLKTPASSGTDGQNWISALKRGADGTMTVYSDGSGGTPISCAYTYVGTTTVE